MRKVDSRNWKIFYLKYCHLWSVQRGNFVLIFNELNVYNDCGIGSPKNISLGG